MVGCPLCTQDPVETDWRVISMPYDIDVSPEGVFYFSKVCFYKKSDTHKDFFPDMLITYDTVAILTFLPIGDL